MPSVVTKNICCTDLQMTLDGVVEQSFSGGMVLSGLMEACKDMPSMQADTAWSLYEHALRLGLTVQRSAQVVLWNVEKGSTSNCSKKHVLPRMSLQCCSRCAAFTTSALPHAAYRSS